MSDLIWIFSVLYRMKRRMHTTEWDEDEDEDEDENSKIFELHSNGFECISEGYLMNLPTLAVSALNTRSYFRSLLL